MYVVINVYVKVSFELDCCVESIFATLKSFMANKHWKGY